MPSPILHETLVNLLAKITEIEDLITTRSIQPRDTIGPPELFLFFDGSTDAYGACVYIKWKLKNPDARHSMQGTKK